MLEIRGLRAGYQGREVLRGVDMELADGQVTAVLGPNGCGKSTLLKALCGIVATSGGSAELDGRALDGMPRRERAQHMAYLAQSRRVPDMTVERLVLSGRFPYLSYPRRYGPGDVAAARAALERMGMAECAEVPMERLSGGQRQKAFIAMALAQDAQVILLDEPTTYLDVGHQLQLLSQARALAAQGRTVAMVLHDLGHALSASDSVALMADGRVRVQGTPQEVYESGALDEVFGVRVRRTWAEGAWRYYCEEA